MPIIQGIIYSKTQMIFEGDLPSLSKSLKAAWMARSFMFNSDRIGPAIDAIYINQEFKEKDLLAGSQ